MLLDTQVVIWLFTNPKRVGARALSAIQATEQRCVSIASQYEVAIKERLGKIELLETLESEMERQAITKIPIGIGQLRELVSLKQIKHRDPFDLLIIALAIERKLTLVTSDRTILSMQIPGLTTMDARK